MSTDEVTIIVVSVLCVLIVIAAIVAVSIYFCCRSKNRRKPGRYELPAPESNHSQSSPSHQDEPAPKPLPKVGSSGLWMSKPIMHTQGPNDAYHQLKPNGIRKEPVMMREILSTPNVNQPTSGYIYQGNLRMYHSQQFPGLVSGYGEHGGAYYNEAFIYPTYVDARLSHRSSMRFLEASGYYTTEELSRENHNRDVLYHQRQRNSSELRESRHSSFLREDSAKPSQFQQKSPHERKSRSIESAANSRSSSKNKSATASTASGAESVIEKPNIQEANRSSVVSSAPAIDKVSESIESRTEEEPFHRDEDFRTQADGKTKAEIATPSTSTHVEPDNSSLDNLHLAPEQRDIPSDQQSYVDSVSDVTDLESKGQKITTQAFEFLDTYISDADDDVDRSKYYSGKS